IMPNHIHMIVLVDDLTDTAQSISTMVRSLKTLVTKEIGKPIFQRSFYDHVIRNDQDYREIWEYIENNPMKWNLDRFYSTEE
ncbi:MAG: transposase, partial [Clostridia bacterium]|nr:transposase [Clostridia bacterium]